MNSIKNFKWILLSMTFALAFASCQKELSQNDQPTTPAATMDDLIVEESFDFSTSQTLDITVVAEDFKGMPATKIDIYNSNPNENGEIIKSGITDRDQKFSTRVNIPSSQEVIHIRRTTFDGTIETVTIDITSNELEYIFSSDKTFGNFKGNVDGPGCEDCTNVISGHQTGTLDVKKNKVYCIESGASFTGNVKLSDGTLKVCGTLTMTNLTGNKGTIIINDDGAFISNNLNVNKKDITIENYSDAFMVSSGPNFKGKFKNYGIVNLAGTNINKDGKLYNYGIINFSNHLNLNDDLYNEGIMNISGNVNNNNGGEIENYCTMNVAGNFNNNDKLKNYSYININGRLTLNNNGKLEMHDQSLIETVDITVNEDIEGKGDEYSKIVVSNNTTINGNAKLKKKLDFCDENGIETNNGTIEESVVFCEVSIPVTYCNPGSNGSGGSGGNDADGDGASDDFDEYPNDPDRAFNNYYPSEGNSGTLGFEDLWPYKGDYDFNDLVIDYNFNTVTNANDNAVETFVTLKVRAIGAAYKNGFGIELPISPDAVSQVTGDFSLTQNIISTNSKNLENAQSKAVIVFFDNAFDLLPHPGDGTGVNTRDGATYVEPVEINFLISYAYPVSVDNLGQAPFNPFIFVNGERGREIHLKNYAPTDLVDTNLFGEGQDASVPGQGYYYKTENNLPWAINIVEEFDYPLEKTEIINGYNYFAQWAESGGSQYPDWYTDNPGYRNNGSIYTP